MQDVTPEIETHDERNQNINEFPETPITTHEAFHTIQDAGRALALGEDVNVVQVVDLRGNQLGVSLSRTERASHAELSAMLGDLPIGARRELLSVSDNTAEELLAIANLIRLPHTIVHELCCRHGARNGQTLGQGLKHLNNVLGRRQALQELGICWAQLNAERISA